MEPVHKSDAFNCPFCDAYSHQIWYMRMMGIGNGNVDLKLLTASFCSRCGEYSLWIDDKMIYPNSTSVPIPLEDMPEDVKEEYIEAMSIVNLSPRGASALLRLALQKLMPHIGGEGKDLNGDIGILVKNGLPVKIQKALDSLRVIGNESVHPGKLNLKDNYEIAHALFKILNLIVEVMIVQPKEIGDLYEGLPDNKKEGIENRDK